MASHRDRLWVQPDLVEEMYWISRVLRLNVIHINIAQLATQTDDIFVKKKHQYR
jgi:hypothetical protein